MSNLLKMMAGAGIAAPLYVDDVFSAYTYTGNGSTQTITNGIDLAGEGGMVWIKHRGPTGTRNHQIFDTVRSMTFASAQALRSNLTDGQADLASMVRADAAGFSLGSSSNDYAFNFSAETYVAWTFRNAPNFFSHSSVVKSSGSNATVSFPDLTTLGMVAVKRTDATGSWYVWHRSLTAGKLLYLEQTAAEATLGHITVSGTTVTLVNGVIADGTYIVYAWAHDTEVDGVIQCGTFTTDGAGASSPVVLNWEEQFLVIKNITGAENWYVFDTQRGFSLASNSAMLRANLSNAEDVGGLYGNPTATGFALAPVFGTSQTYIYLAIRRPNKPPTVGTEVYNAIARTGTGAAATVTGVGFAPDLSIIRCREAGSQPGFFDRLRGTSRLLLPESTAAEATAFGSQGPDFGKSMDGIYFAGGDYKETGNSTHPFINHFFRRAPGFFDEVCYTGTGAAHTEAHNLGVVPELMIVKKRSGVSDWRIYHAALGATKYMWFGTDIAYVSSAFWNDTTPTASVLTVGTNVGVNGTAETYVAYLFATLAGISCVTSYTGNGGTADSAGTSQTINCGFTTGARFVMLKCTSHTSDWVIVDTVRGLVSGNDPALSLNTTAAEVTTTDLLDPDSSGFIVNQLATGTTSANFNVTGQTYLVLAIA